MRLSGIAYLISLVLLPLSAGGQVVPLSADEPLPEPSPAPEPPPAPPDLWSGSLELGGIATTGNTDTSTLTGKFKLVFDSPKWRHDTRLEALKSSDTGKTTAERYQGVYKARYKFSRRSYVFWALRAEQDEFSGYRYQVSESIGYGRNLWKSGRGHLNMEIGPGARQSEINDGTRSEDVIARWFSDFQYAFSKQVELTEELLVQSGKDNTETESVSGLKVKINGALSVRLSYTIKHNSKVPADREKLDTKTAVTLVYDY